MGEVEKGKGEYSCGYVHERVWTKRRNEVETRRSR